MLVKNILQFKAYLVSLLRFSLPSELYSVPFVLKGPTLIDGNMSSGDCSAYSFSEAFSSDSVVFSHAWTDHYLAKTLRGISLHIFGALCSFLLPICPANSGCLGVSPNSELFFLNSVRLLCSSWVPSPNPLPVFQPCNSTGSRAYFCFVLLMISVLRWCSMSENHCFIHFFLVF